MDACRTKSKSNTTTDRNNIQLPNLLNGEPQINPQIRRNLNPIRHEKPVFLDVFVNHYEKYFPTIASNLTIPAGLDAHYISQNLNKNHAILSTKPLKTQNSLATASGYNDSLTEGSQNFFFRQSLPEQDREIVQSIKNYHGINRIKPEIKEKVRNNEFLKVTKSLLIANNNQAHELRPENKKIMGLGTQDLLHLSKFIDPTMIKESIINDNSMVYPEIQRHFGWQKEALHENNEIGGSGMGKVKGGWDSPYKKNLNKQEHFHLEGTKMRTKRTEESGGPRKNDKALVSHTQKKLNFKRSQNKTTPIAESLKRLRISG